MRKLTIILAIVTGFAAQAQTDVDALRYSQTEIGGTSRSIGIAGAIGALGADFGSLSVNPAGIGVYRSSEFMISPAIVSMRSNTDYLFEKNSSFRYNFNFGNIGFVGTLKTGNKDEGWISTSFGFGMNRVASFQNKIYYEGYNASNSMLTNYTQRIESSNASADVLGENYPFDIDLAWQTYLIDTNSDASGVNFFPVANGHVLQRNNITTRGGMSEYVISLGANYSHKLYLGGTLGIPTLRYTEESTYEEEDSKNKHGDFQSYSLYNYLKTTGTGINFKLGMIYRINDWIRLGGAIHTPTYFALTDEYNSNISSQFDTISFDYASPKGTYNYNLTTPWRAIGSLALISKKYGFISVDYEIVDHSYSFFDDNSSASSADVLGTSSVNQTIQNKYGPASNVRVGLEAKADVFRFRAGYAYYATPFQSGVAERRGDNTRQATTFGFGIREDAYYVDLAYVQTIKRSAYFPYTIADAEAMPAAITKTNQNAFQLTLGLTF